MPDALDLPVEELRQDLMRLEALLSLLERTREFGSSNPPTDECLEAWGAARELRSSVRENSAAVPVLSGSLLLYLVGRFEHFATELFRGCCDQIASTCQTFAELPDKMRSQLLILTGRAMSSPNKYRFDAIQVHSFVVRLALNIRAASGVGQVNSECLSVTDANLSASELAELFGRLGFSELWKDVAKQARLKTHLAQATDAGAEAESKARLDSLIAKRNEIAHPTSSPTFPDPESVRGSLRFILVLAETLTEVARMRLMAFAAAGASAPT